MPDSSDNPPSTLPSDPVAALTVFAHMALDFQLQLRTHFAPFFDIDEPSSIKDDVTTVADSLPRSPLLLSINSSLNTIASLSQHLNASSQAPASNHFINTHPTSACALTSNVPKNPNELSRLPRLSELSPQAAPWDEHSWILSRELRANFRRHQHALCGHEEKRFARLVVSSADRPFQNPSQLRHILRDGGFAASVVVVPTANPSVLFICTTKSSLSLLRPAYDRFARISGRDGLPLPRADIVPIGNLPAECRDISSARDLYKSLRLEIQRLADPDLAWRPRLRFARVLHEQATSIRQKLLEMLPTETVLPLPDLPPSPIVASGANWQ